MPALNYTTTIAVEKTMNEITRLLGESGASSIAFDYIDKRPSGVAFSLPTPTGVRVFVLPVRTHAMLNVLARQKKRNPRVVASATQADKVAWRVLKDWLAAQLTLIECEMATLDQVMLPYMRVESGETLYEVFKARQMLELIADGE